jgi:ATP-binding cassette, subfamily B, bacterial MsbA
MSRTVISIQAKQKVDYGRFQPRQFGRMVGLAWRFRRYLISGVLLTVVFAGFHTVSLVGAFPLFKMLLEQEGLHGWVDRTIAQERLGLEFAQTDDSGLLRVVNLGGRASATAPGVLLDDFIVPGDDSSPRALLRQLAFAPSGEALAVTLRRGGEQIETELRPGEPNRKMRLLGWAGSFIPADADTPKGKLRTLSYILGIVLFLVLMANLFRYWGEVLIAKAVLRGLMALRFELYERTLQLPMSFFAGRSTADIVARFVQDIQEIQRGLIAFFGKFLREPLRAVFILGLAFFLDWRLTLTLLIVVPLTVAIFWFVGRTVKKASHKLLLGYGKMIDALTASLHNLRVVKAYTAEDFEQDRLTRLDQKMFKQQLKLAKMQALISPSMESLAVAAGSILTLWLAGRVIGHQLEVAEFVTLGVVLSMLFDPLRKITDVYVRVQRSTAGAERIFSVLDEPIEREHEPPDGLVELQPLEKSIDLEDVTFTYPGADVPVLNGVQLSIRRGETLAVVGPNGSGKTTLVSMLPQFFAPDSGRILYDGVDIRRASLKSLRRQISLVTQEAIIFAGTPIENITYGLSLNGQFSTPRVSARADFSPSSAPERTSDLEERARAAARQAFADEFIQGIPGGYWANLGERGTTLSGGQRQRIAIARAICRNAPVLIFDEATSQVDTESELKIQQALREFAKDRTTIIIAHRLSTIQFADRIVVMDSGRIVDVGKHEELFDRCSLYRALCETQFVTEGSA